MRRAGSSAKYTGPRNANQTLTQLVAVLDRQDVAHAIERLEKGHEFRDVVLEARGPSGELMDTLRSRPGMAAARRSTPTLLRD